VDETMIVDPNLVVVIVVFSIGVTIWIVIITNKILRRKHE
jgi:hypothetical protein